MGFMGAVALVALAVWVWETNNASGNDEPGGHVHESAELTPADAEALEATATSDRYVRHILAGRRSEVAQVIPWTSEGGREVLGAEIRIAFSPTTTLEDERVPVLLTPGPKAPPGTPNLERYALYSARHVSELRTIVDLDPQRVVEIVPAGRKVEITRIRVPNPPANSAAYGGDPGA